jgi:hypothetical protein
MLTIEIKVNGNLVAAVSAANTGYYPDGERCHYEARGVEFGPLGSIPQAWASEVDHKRADGILTLAALLLKDAAGQ